MAHVSPGIVCQAPSGRLDDAEVFRGFMGPFVQIVTRTELRAAFGDESTAVLVYDTDTSPVRDAPGAECLTLEHGKITYMRIVSDQLPFADRAAIPRTSGAIEQGDVHGRIAEQRRGGPRPGRAGTTAVGP